MTLLYRARGFFALPLAAYVALGAAALLLVMGIALKVQSSRLEACKESYAAFKTEVERLGKEAEARAKAQVKKQKGATNAVRTDLNTALKRMRESSGSRSMPTAPDNPERADDPSPQLRLDCAPLRDRATEDALRLHYFQDFVRRQGFPIE